MKPGDLIKWRNWKSDVGRWQTHMGVLLDNVDEYIGSRGVAISAGTRILTESGVQVMYGKPLYPIDMNKYEYEPW